MGSPRALLIFTIATAVVVAVFAGVAAVSEWWILPVALAVHLAGTVAVLAVVRASVAQEDKPDPVTAARIEEGADEEHEISGNGSRRPEKPHMGI